MTPYQKRLHGYFHVFCEFYRKIWIYLFKKIEVFTKFKLWKEKNDLPGGKMKYLWSDNEPNYIDSSFQKICAEHDIKRHFLLRKMPHAERMIISLSEVETCPCLTN